MGTKPAPLNVGDRMWLRASQDLPGGYGRGCWVVAFSAGEYLIENTHGRPVAQRTINVHLDDGSGRTRDEQLADPMGQRRWVARGQLMAYGCATQMRESHQAYMARQAALELEQLQASRRAAAEASQAETEARKVMDAAELAYLRDPAAFGEFHKLRAAHDAAWRKSHQLAMRLPIMWVDDGAGGLRHLTEAQAAHQHWLDEFARTAAALEVTYGTQV